MLSFEFSFLLEQRLRAGLKVLQISPNSSFVALKQPLKLNVTLNVTDKRYFFSHLVIQWSFRRFSSISFQGLALVSWRVNTDRVYTYSYDPRASIVNYSTLVLVNTSLNDSGTYQCRVWSIFYDQYLYFNVTIEGRLFFVNLLKIVKNLKIKTSPNKYLRWQTKL